MFVKDYQVFGCLTRIIRCLVVCQELSGFWLFDRQAPSPPPPALFLLPPPPPFSSFLVRASNSSRVVSLLISPLLNLSTTVAPHPPDLIFLPGKLERSCHQLLRLNTRSCTELFENLLQLLPSFLLLATLLIEGFQKGQG